MPRPQPDPDPGNSGPPIDAPWLGDASPSHARRGTAPSEQGRTDSVEPLADRTATADALASWIDGYVRAWNSNDPDDVAALFTADAEYRTEPYAAPVRGLDAIVAFWLANGDEPGRTTFAWTPITVTADVAVVEGTTEYRDDPPKTYSNLWVIRLDGHGRCTSFTEWWMQHPADA